MRSYAQQANVSRSTMLGSGIAGTMKRTTKMSRESQPRKREVNIWRSSMKVAEGRPLVRKHRKPAGLFSLYRLCQHPPHAALTRGSPPPLRSPMRFKKPVITPDLGIYPRYLPARLGPPFAFDKTSPRCSPVRSTTTNRLSPPMRRCGQMRLLRQIIPRRKRSLNE
jgi:hypothetical protein